MKVPLYEKLLEYTGARFHMPGHNGKALTPLYASSCFDITELSFSDNLLFADGVIAEAEMLAAHAYNTAYTRFFTCGATSAIHT
ncbi:MAG: amino acid decarboxylase, partial [Clostridia bacterium]|nr:amino acid decarboxylase [Clostridia bacterium]